MTPVQFREHAKQWDDDGRYSIGEVFRAHADALEELARLKAPVEGEIAAGCGMLDGYISNALPGIDTEIMRLSRALIESIAFQYKEMEDAALFNCEQSYKREAELTERAERAEAERDNLLGVNAALRRDYDGEKSRGDKWMDDCKRAEAELAKAREKNGELHMVNHELHRQLAESERKIERLKFHADEIMREYRLSWAGDIYDEDFDKYPAIAAYRAYRGTK